MSVCPICRGRVLPGQCIGCARPPRQWRRVLLRAGRDEMARASWRRAGGQWAAVERTLTVAIVDALDYDHALYAEGAAWCSHADTDGEPDVLLVGLTGPESWARVRVSVEVLDGVL